MEVKKSTKNLKNLVKEDPVMTLVDKLLASIPDSLESPVTLPSKGKLYTTISASGAVSVSPVTFQTELDMVSKSDDKDFDPVQFLFERHVHGIDLNELLAMDRFAILLELRRISYGNDCKSSVLCPFCKTENILNFSIKDFPVNFVPEGITDPRKIKLPVLGVDAEVYFPRYGDTKGKGTGVDFIGKNLWRFVGSIDGVEDKVQISNLLSDKRFPLRDISALIKAVAGDNYGVQTVAMYECCNENCKEVSEARFEVTPDFLSFTQ